MSGTLTLDTLSDKLNNSTSATNVIRGSARAWVHFTGSSVPSIQSSFNVSSITYNGTGDFTATFTNAMPNANLVVAGFGRISGNGGFMQMASNTPFTTTTCRFGTAVNGGGFSDPIITGIVIFGT